MPQKKKRVKVADLKGAKLYNFLLKTLGEDVKLNPKKQQLGITSRRRLVKEVLYPKFKDGKVTITEIRKSIKGIIRGLPPAEICNPLFLKEVSLAAEDYYEIDNHIRTVLPDCVDVIVNAGQFGKTQMFNTANYSYYATGVRKIIENIREALDNNSGVAQFYGVVKLKKKRPNDGKAENYYIEYLLYFNGETELDDTPVDYDIPKKYDKIQQEIDKGIFVVVKKQQKEKRKRKLAKKKARPDYKLTQYLASLQLDKQSLKSKLEAGRITKEQYKKNLIEINKDIAKTKRELAKLKKKP
jgi:hypothetical protein